MGSRICTSVAKWGHFGWILDLWRSVWVFPRLIPAASLPTDPSAQYNTLNRFVFLNRFPGYFTDIVQHYYYWAHVTNNNAVYCTALLLVTWARVSYFIIMMDVYLLKYPVLCSHIRMRFWGSFFCHMKLMSIQTPFLLLLFTDSVPAALSPTRSAPKEEMIKGGREIRDPLCWAPMSFPGFPPPRGSSHMSGILAKSQLTRSRFSVYMPGLFSSVCSELKYILRSLIVSSQYRADFSQKWWKSSI